MKLIVRWLLLAAALLLVAHLYAGVQVASFGAADNNNQRTRSFMGREHSAAPRRFTGAHVMRADDRNALHEGEKRSPRGKKASHRGKL